MKKLFERMERRIEKAFPEVKKWQDDKAFVAWLVSQQYAYPEGDKLKHHFGGDGIILYMFEAWCAALATQNKKLLGISRSQSRGRESTSKREVR
jgi:hypothetical protein